MDPLDTIFLLRRVTEDMLSKKESNEEKNKQLSDYLSRLNIVETIIRSSIDGSSISEDDFLLINNVIDDSRSIFTTAELALLDPSQWVDDKLPSALHLTNLIGAVNLSSLSQLKKGSSKIITYDPISFSLRGKNYLKDGKKVRYFIS